MANTLLGALGVIDWRLDEAIGELQHLALVLAQSPRKEHVLLKTRALIMHDRILTDFPRGYDK